jgi:hypothetical protein
MDNPSSNATPANAGTTLYNAVRLEQKKHRNHPVMNTGLLFFVKNSCRTVNYFDDLTFIVMIASRRLFELLENIMKMKRKY